MKPALLLALSILALIGCASTMQPPPADCSADEFRGFGVGENENEALTEAHAALARQVNSSVKVTVERAVNQQVSDGKENLSSGYESRTIIESSLSNVSDARIVRSKRNGNKTNITVCMTKADAAKGFIERQRLLQDSLVLASNTEISTEHPKQKNEAWRKTQILYRDFMRIQYLLEGWGVKSPYVAAEAYSKAREDYRNYCQSVKVFWQDAGNECSDAIFAMFSKKIKMEKSQCSGGMNLNLDCSERCKSSPYGIECSYEPSLSIESCGSEKYSLLKAKELIKGSDIQNEVRAKGKLIESLHNAAFFGEWEKEVKEWVPQCVD